MAKANPKAWFPGCIAQISYKSVDAWAERNKSYKPYFPTWNEAHDFMLTEAIASVAKSEKALASAKRHLIKVQAIKPPATEI